VKADDGTGEVSPGRWYRISVTAGISRKVKSCGMLDEKLEDINSISLNQFYSRAIWMLWRQLNQRSQRKSYNWKGFNELLEQFQIERPRIVQRPRTSTTPFSGLGCCGMRVSLKSPVRQFRTPGSVRGLTGNWQTYRDDGLGSESYCILLFVHALFPV
jgi:hypothetical protein